MSWVDDLAKEMLAERPAIARLIETDAFKYQKYIITVATLVDVARSMEDARIYRDVAEKIISDTLIRRLT
jgi:hypothetical protein